RGFGTPGYRGEAYTLSGAGHAELARFTPNEVVVRVTDGRAGDTLILNQNYDPGWRVDGNPVSNQADAIAATLRGGNQELHFRFRARGMFSGCLVFLATLGMSFWVYRRLRRFPTQREQVEPVGHP